MAREYAKYKNPDCGEADAALAMANAAMNRA
jgi:hypothetical protein